MARVPFFDLRGATSAIRTDLLNAAESVIGSGHFILADQLTEFERAFATFCGVRHAVGVGNGLDALVLILRALKIGPGDDVIVPGHTFIATWLAVTQCGATPVAADIDPVSFNIAIERIRGAITPRTKAIIAVHLYGRAADMTALRDIAAEHGIALVEDAAQAHGACHEGQPVGGLGRAAAFSFYPTKNLGALGDGGAVTTNDDELADRVRRLRNYGSRTKYLHDDFGVNSRLDELQAAFLAAKLPFLADQNERRRAIARRYSAGLGQLNGVTCPDDDPHAVWHLYVIRADQRDQLQHKLTEFGVGTLVHYPIPPHMQPIYSNAHGHAELPESLRASQEVLSLPLWPNMTDEQVDTVIEAVTRAVEAKERG